MKLSIIVPMLNEAAQLGNLLSGQQPWRALHTGPWTGQGPGDLGERMAHAARLGWSVQVFMALHDIDEAVDLQSLPADWMPTLPACMSEAS